MGIFGTPLTEKIRRSAAAALPQATWKIDVDWSGGSKLHRLHGTVPDPHTEAETMQFAHDVWAAIATQYRLDPKDARDGLLNVGVTSLGGVEQLTGITG